MRFILWLAVWLRRIVVFALLFALLLAAPILYTETSCVGKSIASDYAGLLPEADRRDESRTYTTYPEWHIVFAYEDYARVVAAGDPHDFGYFQAIWGFWSALCPLAEKASEHGGFSAESKQTIYTIGASFTAEMLWKAAYEESLGRIATLVRGDGRAALDDLSAEQAAAYAEFLHQTPWYKWNFSADAAALLAADAGSPRDWERAVALNVEYRAKSAFAGVIGAAVTATTGPDELTIRSVVSGLTPAALAAIDGVTVIGPAGGRGTIIETPRYRAFTTILLALAAANAEIVEIAGNDDIVFTVISRQPTLVGAIRSFPRQGAGDYRHLVETKVWGLASRLRQYAAQGIEVEHVYDY